MKPEEIYIGETTLHRVDGKEFAIKKELTGFEWAALRYVAMEKLACGMTWNDFDDMNAYQGDSLYLGNFDGFTVEGDDGEYYNLASCHFNPYGVPVFAAWDTEADTCAYYVAH